MSEKKISSSIVFRLNSWHITRMLSSFIAINVLIALLFFAALFYGAEREVSNYAANLPSVGMAVENPSRAFKIPAALEIFFDNNMHGAYRTLYKTSWSSSFWKSAASLKYRAYVPYEGMYYALDYDLGFAVSTFLRLFIVLLIFELLTLIFGIRKGARVMGRALQPIAQLTKTAKTISTMPESQIKDLKGKIESIGGQQLDARVSIGSSQKELRELAVAINEMLDRISSAYSSQIRFVSDASHELRTPISVIQGYANLLDRWGKNDEKALNESIDAIKSEAAGMKDLIEQLLFLARGDNETISFNTEEVNISEMAKEIIREAAMIDPSHEFCKKIQDDIYILGDGQLLKQAIRIFVDNSIKYTPQGEAIKVLVSQEGRVVKISVSDNGIGISPEDLPHVFDRFFRSDESRARKTGGTGLGLSIAKWIIDKHGGGVEIVSRRDIGTKITIVLNATIDIHNKSL